MVQAYLTKLAEKSGGKNTFKNGTLLLQNIITKHKKKKSRNSRAGNNKPGNRNSNEK